MRSYRPWIYDSRGGNRVRTHLLLQSAFGGSRYVVLPIASHRLIANSIPAAEAGLPLSRIGFRYSTPRIELTTEHSASYSCHYYHSRSWPFLSLPADKPSDLFLSINFRSSLYSPFRLSYCMHHRFPSLFL